jgi:hypothetical protein
LHMRIETFERALDFLERSGIDEARLLGGEPTLHPEFPRLAGMAAERGLRVRLFSNGLMPEAALRWLEGQPPDRVAVLVNVAPGDLRQTRALKRLGNRASLGLTVYTPALDPGFLLDLIREYDLSPSIRFGLAHPSADASNRFLHPAHYRAVGTRLARFFEAAQQVGVELSFDCGFVPCMFPPGFLEALGPAARDIGTRCSPVLDILPDGQVVSCYPLGALAREPLSQAETADALRSRFVARFAGYRRLGVFRECAACELHCNGGCLAASMQRLRPASTSVSKVEPPPARRWVVPYVDQSPAFWERLEEEFGRHIREVYFPMPGEVAGSGRPPQPTSQLEWFLKKSRLARAVLINPITLPRPIEEIAPAIIEALRRLIGEFGIASATVSNLLLAARIRDTLPALPLTASVLMDIAQPNQALMLKGICDTLVPASRVMRDLPVLQALRAAFPGRIRLIVNEGCLPGCPYRVQHFHEMCAGFPRPESLCRELLERDAWMRLTGAWVLPQHLYLLEGVSDEWKLSGRVTLRDATTYRRVLGGYIHRRALAPHEIGGGPALPLEPIEIDDDFYARTLRCGRRCHECSECREVWERRRISDIAI